MARKKKKDEVENYFNNVANYQTEAEAGPLRRRV